jgi:hypothetical protein
MKQFTLFLIIVFVSACAVANPTVISGSPLFGIGHFRVNQVGHEVIATGCFSTTAALGRETQKIFNRFMQKCLARVYMQDGKLAVEEKVSATGEKLFCTKVVYSTYDCQ